MKTVEGEIHATAYNSGKTIAELADDIGINEMYLYKMLSTGTLKIKHLKPLMKSCKDFRTLKHLCHINGFLCVRLPRVSKSKKEDNQMVNDYQKLTTTTVSLLMVYLEKPSQTNKATLLYALNSVAENSIGIRKRVQIGNQLEAF